MSKELIKKFKEAYGYDYSNPWVIPRQELESLKTEDLDEFFAYAVPVIGLKFVTKENKAELITAFLKDDFDSLVEPYKDGCVY